MLWGLFILSLILSIICQESDSDEDSDEKGGRKRKGKLAGAIANKGKLKEEVPMKKRLMALYRGLIEYVVSILNCNVLVLLL